MAPRKKVDPKAAADAAEARSKSNKNTKASTVAAPKTSPAVAAAAKSPDTDKEAKALFLQALPKIADLKAKLNTATANLRNAYKTAKSDGFLKSDFDEAFEIQGAEGEKKKKAAIARSLTIAKWLGCDLGSQLDLFVQDARVPAADRAYEEGQAASMKGESLKCEYHPATEQYRQFAKGYHDDQETRIKKGITKLPVAVAEDQKEAGAKVEANGKQRAADAKEFDAPASGTPMTREQYKRQQEALAN